MDAVLAVAIALVSAIVGAVAVWLLMRGRETQVRGELVAAQAELKRSNEELSQAKVDRGVAETEAASRASQLAVMEIKVNDLSDELRAMTEKFHQRDVEWGTLNSSLEEKELAFLNERERLEKLLEESDKRLKEAFENLSNQTLKATTEDFMKRAQEVLEKYRENAEGDLTTKQKAIEELMRPMKEQLERLDNANKELEEKRTGAYSSIKDQIEQLTMQQVGLQKETSRLVKALQDPGSAGQWGEMVLERVVEMAGLQDRVDFETQATQSAEDGSRQRPDMVVKLPGDRTLVIDSKAPMKSYLDGLESTDEASQQVLFADHAKKLLEHSKVLNRRDYVRGDSAPDFTVMFVPSESAFRVAMEVRPGLMEEALSNNVVIATPTTLLALLRAVAYGWQQEKFAKEAHKVRENGRVLYERLTILVDHYAKLGKALEQAGKAYNSFGSSLESRVLPAARQFKDSGITTNKDVAVIEPIELHPKALIRTDAPEGSQSLLGLDD